MKKFFEFKKLKTKRPYFLSKASLLWVSALAAIGIVTLIISHAATSSSSIEPEDGNPSSGITQITDGNASGGTAVRFGVASNGGGTISAACKYSTTVTPAFCATFDSPYSGAKTQTGDLDPVLWGVSRMGAFDFGNQRDAISFSHNACAGGGTTGNPMLGDPSSHTFGPATPPPADMRICNGLMVESNNDGGTVAAIDSYPKQPFNFTGRTGRVVFDVTGDATGSHGAWPEFVITDEPVPGTLRCISECPIAVNAQNEIGFSLAGGDFTNGKIGVDRIFVSRNGVFEDVPVTVYSNNLISGCLANHSYNCSVTKMNHIEVQVSTTRIDIYGTDAGQTTLKHLVGADYATLGFSQGLIWMNDVHYNAHKAIEPGEIGTQYDHSFAWDNVGFDGPKTYRDLGYDVPLNTEVGPNSQNGDSTVNVGYTLTNGSRTWSIPGITWQQTPTKVKVVFNYYSYDANNVISASLNGHTAVSKTGIGIGYHSSTMAIELPFSDVVSGANGLKMTASSGTTVLSNISVILVSGAPVP